MLAPPGLRLVVSNEILRKVSIPIDLGQEKEVLTETKLAINKNFNKIEMQTDILFKVWSSFY